MMLPFVIFGLYQLNENWSSDNDFTTWPLTHYREFITWFVTAVAITGVLSMSYYYGLRQEHTFALRCKITPGTFVEDRGQHNEITYSFVSKNSRYYGSDNIGNRLMKNLKTGEPFDVYYDPFDPTSNTMAPSHFFAKSFVIFIVFDIFAVGLLAIAIRKVGAITRTGVTWKSVGAGRKGQSRWH